LAIGEKSAIIDGVIVGGVGMAGMSAVINNRITAALETTSFGQRGFDVKHDGQDDSVVTIVFSARSEYQFAIDSTAGGFITSERPGPKSDLTEAIQRGDIESCIQAIREWAERIADREAADILDEFGGVADRNPRLPTN
jgi:hypothetical protein